MNERDVTKFPNCGGEADNGFDRDFPPSPYLCTKCMAILYGLEPDLDSAAPEYGGGE